MVYNTTHAYSSTLTIAVSWPACNATYGTQHPWVLQAPNCKSRTAAPIAMHPITVRAPATPSEGWLYLRTTKREQRISMGTSGAGGIRIGGVSVPTSDQRKEGGVSWGVCGENWLGWVTSSLFPIHHQSLTPTKKTFCCGKKVAQNASFNHILLVLGRPWGGEFVGFAIIFICFPTQHNLVYRKHPTIANQWLIL